jgi:hypothetical protein
MKIKQRARLVLALSVLSGTLVGAFVTATAASATGIATKTVIVGENPPAAAPSDTVTITAQVNPQTSGPAMTGTVTFFYKVIGDSNKIPPVNIGSAPVSGSPEQATLTVAPGTLPTGVLNITAKYSGDPNYAASQGTVSYTVSATCDTGPWPTQTDGYPNVAIGGPMGLYIGQSNGWWTIYVQHPENVPTHRVKFSGTVTTNPDHRLIDVTALKNEHGDYVKLNGDNKLSFNFVDIESLDGFSFFAACGNAITFSLNVAGVKAPVSDIFFGNPTSNSASNPVTFNRTS